MFAFSSLQNACAADQKNVAPRAPDTLSSIKELKRALSNAKGGETLLLAPGNYGKTSFKNLKFPSLVTITSADPGNPANFYQSIRIIKCANIKLDHVNFIREKVPSAGWSPQLEVWQVDNFTLSNSVITSPLPTADQKPEKAIEGIPYGGAILFRGGSNILAEKLTISNTHRGIIVFNDTNNLTIKDNHMHKVREDGVHIGGSARNILIENNEFTEFVLAPKDHGDMIQIRADGKKKPGPTNIKIRNNYFAQGSSEHFTHAMLLADMENFTITGNIISNGHLHGISFSRSKNGTISNNILLPANEGVPRLGRKIVPQIRVGRKSENITVKNNVTLHKVEIDKTIRSEVTTQNNSILSETPGTGNYFRKEYQNLGAMKIEDLRKVMQNLQK